MFKPEYIIVHHTAVSREKNELQYNAVKEYHISKGWGDIGYHFFIEPQGLLMKGRGEIKEGAHCKEANMNERSFGVCLAGDFDREDPTPEQMRALKDVLNYLRVKYDIPRQNVKFHRDYAVYKSCPGTRFSREMLNKTMAMKELKRDNKGGFWFVKTGDNGKQKVDSLNGLITVISREFGVDTMDDKYLGKLVDKKYF